MKLTQKTLSGKRSKARFDSPAKILGGGVNHETGSVVDITLSTLSGHYITLTRDEAIAVARWVIDRERGL